MAASGGSDSDGVPRIASGALEFEERGDEAGVPAGTLQRIGGHDPARFGTMDDGLLGGSIQFLEGRQRNGMKNQQTSRW